MPGHTRIPGVPDTLKEKVISFLKEIKGVSNIKSPDYVGFVYNKSKFIVGKFYDGEFIVCRIAKNGDMITNKMRSKSFKDFKERLPKFISLNFRKRTLPYIFYKNDKIEATASTESKQFSYKGQVITASSKEEAIQVFASGFLGKQKFTKAQLKAAYDKMLKNIKEDKENIENPPDNGYDIRNGYTTGKDKDICGREGHDWDFAIDDFEGICKEIESIPELITYGDLEVYWNSNKHNMAEPDNHGIIIEDGEIKQVY